MLGNVKNEQTPVDGVFHQGSRIEGDAFFVGGMRIDGRVLGNVQGEGKGSFLVLGPTGFIEGKVEAETIIIEGEARGPVTGSISVLIRATGKVSGVVTYGRIQMVEGCRVEGMLQPGAPSVELAASEGSTLDEKSSPSFISRASAFKARLSSLRSLISKGPKAESAL